MNDRKARFVASQAVIVAAKKVSSDCSADSIAELENAVGDLKAAVGEPKPTKKKASRKRAKSGAASTDESTEG